MSWWWLVRRFPKFFIVATIFIASTGLFGWWWLFRSPKKVREENADAANQRAETAAKVALVQSKIEHLILADNDLYDLDSGQLIFKSWLADGMPFTLSYDSASKKLVAHYKNGFVRYNLDGTEDAKMLQRFTMVVMENKWTLFVKNKDVWRADIDWQNFTLSNEKQVSSIEQFMDTSFEENILLCTEKTLVVRNMMRLLRVDLETGTVHPTLLPLGNPVSQRSPDCKLLIGITNGQFYHYDVDTDHAEATKLGRVGMSACQWLSEGKCVCILNGQSVVLYDRDKDALSELCKLPVPCSKIGEPSPDGRYVFCTNNRQGFLVDVEKKTAQAITGGAGVTWLTDDTFAFSREVPDSSLRGTWTQKVGEDSRLLSPEPFVGKPETFPELNKLVCDSGKGFVCISTLDGSMDTLALHAAPHQFIRISEMAAGK
ncbi:MAG: hypothetical protein QM796_20605 [Chthoniobacteraceae bacterium]